MVLYANNLFLFSLPNERVWEFEEAILLLAKSKNEAPELEDLQSEYVLICETHDSAQQNIKMIKNKENAQGETVFLPN